MFGEMTTSKRVTFIVGLSLLVIAVVLAWGYVSPSRPHGKVVARLQKKDSGGYIHTVTVRQFAGRLNTELSEEGKPVRDLPLSSYEFYEGSDPIKTVTISWPELQRFTVSFNNGVTVDCSWVATNCVWTLH